MLLTAFGLPFVLGYLLPRGRALVAVFGPALAIVWFATGFAQRDEGQGYLWPVALLLVIAASLAWFFGLATGYAFAVRRSRA